MAYLTRWVEISGFLNKLLRIKMLVVGDAIGEFVHVWVVVVVGLYPDAERGMLL